MILTDRCTSVRAACIFLSGQVPLGIFDEKVRMLTNSPLSPGFIHAEHGYIPSIDFTLVNILLAYYHANRLNRAIVRFAGMFRKGRESLHRNGHKMLNENVTF
jgi:hypothetical protein